MIAITAITIALARIWKQTNGSITLHLRRWFGGTIAGVGRFLKEQPLPEIGLADLDGSISTTTPYRMGRKGRGRPISEGIGQGRITANLAEAPIDMAFRLSDIEALPLIMI